jgi:CPA1 family monovalent cation:H+ antiporter
VVRILVVTFFLGLLRLLQLGHKSSLFTLSWGGLRGGLSIALVLSVTDIQTHTWILVTTHLVVFFSVVRHGVR